MNSKIAVIDCGSSKVSDIKRCLEELNTEFTVVKWESIKSSIKTAKGIIISGNPELLTQIDTKKYLDKFAFLKDFENPVLGICFGHQILGMLYGSKVSLGAEVRGTEAIEIVNSSSLFNEIKDEIIMAEDHCEEINLPKDFKLIASSTSCKVEAMQHKIKPLFGVQFHPEVSGVQGLILLKNFVKTCN